MTAGSCQEAMGFRQKTDRATPFSISQWAAAMRSPGRRSVEFATRKILCSQASTLRIWRGARPDYGAPASAPPGERPGKWRQLVAPTSVLERSALIMSLAELVEPCERLMVRSSRESFPSPWTAESSSLQASGIDMDFDGDCISFVVMPSAAAFKYIAPSPGVEIADSGDAFSSGGCTVLHRWALASPNCWKICETGNRRRPADGEKKLISARAPKMSGIST